MKTGEQSSLVLTSGFFELNRVIHNQFAKLVSTQIDFGLPMSSMQIMMLLDNLGSVTVSEISKYFAIAKPNVTPMLDKLCDKGYVDRIRDNGDKRIVHVELTGKGTDIVNKIKTEIGEIILSMAQAYGPDGERKMIDAFDILMKLFDAAEE